MKKSFFLYLLVLSPLIFAQGKFQYDTFDKRQSEIDILFADIKENLCVVAKESSVNQENFFLINANDTEESSNTFSSLQLVEQLKELNLKSPFNVNHNPTLERFIRVYLNNRKEDLSNLMGLSLYYFPIFEAYLDKYNLPLELKYLAIVESALVNNAVSPSGAKGLWQFMLPTGKENGLEINSFVDERYSTLKSTEAACKYLVKLYDVFEDWDLALAAYNSGATNVKKAISRSGGMTNYWEIRKYLPSETRGYIPAFYATYYLFEYAKTHQLAANFSELIYLDIDTVHIKKPLTFKAIQKRIPIEMELLKSLNPEFKKAQIPFSKTKVYTLNLPNQFIDDFIKNESFFYHTAAIENQLKSPSSSLKVTSNNSYEVQLGDNLKSIALKFNISLAQLKKWNGLETNYLIKDQRLVITDQESNSSASQSVQLENTNKSKNNAINSNDGRKTIDSSF